MFFRSGTSGSFGVPAPPDDKRQNVDLEVLDSYALERWEVNKASSSSSCPMFDCGV
jgi:hypothetical protein